MGGEDTEYINIYIQKQQKVITDLTNKNLINDTKLDLVTKKYNDLSGVYENEKKSLSDKIQQLQGEVNSLVEKNNRDVNSARQEYIDKYKDSIHTIQNLEKRIRELDKGIKDQAGIIDALENNLKSEREKNHNLDVENKRLVAKVNTFNTRKKVTEMTK
jgi:predicted RNase H-like nuclease (RuvC/YqgF family)